jgi:septal ring factor EnvC (AmiA/AmiB activator)
MQTKVAALEQNIKESERKVIRTADEDQNLSQELREKKGKIK